ncbi:LicD family protein [Thalassotalea psychrophila]|uniref:LicD family protein n=1 Tax=Thalassotalea psychrophila TaxID=3065647 RepID=A0ABY9TXR4_9GAMM|nr:LicD family protein [Colwelliaceae bacterium SQ149]
MSDIKKIQQFQLSILKEVISVIEKYGLNYIAVGGTALGAFRHNAFIPWDDDIDIAMPRKDYDTFLTLQNELPDNLFIQNYNTDKHYPLYFSKVRLDNTKFVERRFKNQDMHQGIFIDIFPLDQINLNDKISEKVNKQENKFRRLVKNSPKKWLYWMAYGFINPTQAFAQLESLIKRNTSANTNKFVSIQANDSFDFENLYPIQTLPFEDIQICVPNNIEHYLENKYGDYMRIPEEHERRLHDVIELKFNVDKPT